MRFESCAVYIHIYVQYIYIYSDCLRNGSCDRNFRLYCVELY